MAKKRSEMIKSWEEQARKLLVGRTVKEVRYMTALDLEQLGFSRSGLIIIFNDGLEICASADDEGNDAGALFTSDEKLQIIPVI